MGISKIKMNKIERQDEENAKHIAILNSEMGETRDEMKKTREEITTIRIEVNTIKTDVDWLKRFFFIIATSSIGALVVGIMNLMGKT